MSAYMLINFLQLKLSTASGVFTKGRASKKTKVTRRSDKSLREHIAAFSFRHS